MLDWQKAYSKLNKAYLHAIKEASIDNSDVFVRFRLHNYPPRVTIDIAFKSIDKRRKETWIDYTNPVFIYEEYNDEELRRATDIAMNYFRLMGEGLKIYRDKRPQKGVVRFTIKPEDYSEWG
jgi:hypothetical protein